MPQIGFVILSHDFPNRLLRLTRRLLSSFPGSGIACHHSFDRCPLETTLFPSSVWFVRPSLQTMWGHISLIYAQLRALELLYNGCNPNWFAILSGSDYPIVSYRQILEQLSTLQFDAYLDHRAVAPMPTHLQDLRPASFTEREWLANASFRYHQTQLGPHAETRIAQLSKTGIAAEGYIRILQSEHLLVRSSRPFPVSLTCWAGDHWLIGNRKVAETLLNRGSVREAVLGYLGNCIIPDEAVYQSILCNTSGLKISSQNKRFSDWTEKKAHPKVLTASDLSNVLTSDAYFARKFESFTVLDAVDAFLDASQSRNSS